jgi:AraC family transcriptional regulator
MASWHLELSKHPDGGALDLEVLKRRSWPGLSAQFVRIAAPTTYGFKLASTSNYVALHDLYRVDGETVVSGLGRSFTKDLRNKLSYIPAGWQVHGWARIDKPGTIGIVTIDQGNLNRCPIDLSDLPPLLQFEDVMLRSVMLRFQAILDDPSLDAPGYAETLAELLVFELARVTSGRRDPRSAPSGLTERQVRLITDYMDGHIDEKMTVADLAALVDLTRYHFIRSFKLSTGMPPHQFMIHRRIDRAKDMLTERDASVAEIAERTGFGSSVQFTRTFRRIVGTTPTAFRRES